MPSHEHPALFSRIALPDHVDIPRPSSHATVSTMVALDLDQTVVFSHRSARNPRTPVVVEHLEGSPLSVMTARAHRLYTSLAASTLLVPITSRTRTQFERITLPAPAPLALVANGGMLLVEGEPDEHWAEWVAARMLLAAPLAHVLERFEAFVGQDWVALVRNVEDLFVYLMATERELIPPGLAQELTAALAPLGWEVSLQGRKLYAVPTSLTKSSALAALAEATGMDSILAAGDSVLDRPMLQLALGSGGAARPAHGELHELGWAPGELFVTSSAGAAAGEEILDWALARAGELS